MTRDKFFHTLLFWTSINVESMNTQKFIKSLSAWFVLVIVLLMLCDMGVDAVITLTLAVLLVRVLVVATDGLLAKTARRLLDFSYRIWPKAKHAR